MPWWSRTQKSSTNRLNNRKTKKRTNNASCGTGTLTLKYTGTDPSYQDKSFTVSTKVAREFCEFLKGTLDNTESYISAYKPFMSTLPKKTIEDLKRDQEYITTVNPIYESLKNGKHNIIYMDNTDLYKTMYFDYHETLRQKQSKNRYSRASTTK